MYQNYQEYGCIESSENEARRWPSRELLALICRSIQIGLGIRQTVFKLYYFIICAV